MASAARNITIPTVKSLFALSGNKCSMCKTSIVLPDKTVLGQMCHIEAANDKGERWNPNMTDEQRASYDNLILLCANCHLISNNENEFTVAKLKQIKEDHQRSQSGETVNSEFEKIFLRNQTYNIDFTEKEDWGILEEIINYTLENSAKHNLGDGEIKESKGFLDFKKKVQQNFPQEERNAFSNTYRSTTAKGTVIRDYLNRQSIEDSAKVDELTNSIVRRFCILSNVSDPNSSIGSVKIIEELAMQFIPDVKKNSPGYQGVAIALIIQIFEFCYIGSKTSVGAQFSLFD